ncbi:MAG TPA: menaquinone biosynthesis protein [Deltaproteobacteria bacterium]|nr:menaquinone biosynthesis protein [Deltaproteobacteria bacterium]HQB38362.1 menaquinone biosynthesis protein [Deltaproteobacteria bacterium]
MLRIGHIQYANCTPIFHALHELYPCECHGLTAGVPAELNSLLVSGLVDVCPSSSIMFSKYPDDLLIFPELSISSCGPVRSVLLFTQRPIERLDGCVVLLSAESATSVNLLKILLSKCYGLSCRFQVTSSLSPKHLDADSALLLIGDAALKSAMVSHRMHVYDLGELWSQWTETPFVFALWLARRTAFEAFPEDMAQLASHFVSSKHHALSHLDRIADSAPEAFWMGREQLLDYWQVLSYDLSEAHLKGLRLFYNYAAQMGLIPFAPELSFLPI